MICHHLLQFLFSLSTSSRAIKLQWIWIGKLIKELRSSCDIETKARSFCYPDNCQCSDFRIQIYFETIFSSTSTYYFKLLPLPRMRANHMKTSLAADCAKNHFGISRLEKLARQTSFLFQITTIKMSVLSHASLFRLHAFWKHFPSSSTKAKACQRDKRISFGTTRLNMPNQTLETFLFQRISFFLLFFVLIKKSYVRNR